MDANQVRSWVEAAEQDKARCFARIAVIDQTLPGLKRLLAEIESETNGLSLGHTHSQNQSEDARAKPEDEVTKQSLTAPANGNGHKVFDRASMTVASAAEHVMMQADRRWHLSEILEGIKQLGLPTSEDTLSRQLRGDPKKRFQRVDVKTYVFVASNKGPDSERLVSNNGTHSRLLNQQQVESTKFNLTQAVREAVGEMLGSFTRAQVSERICEKHSAVRDKVQASQVSVALSKLQKQGAIFVEQKGEGAVPNIYGRIDAHKRKGQ